MGSWSCAAAEEPDHALGQITPPGSWAPPRGHADRLFWRLTGPRTQGQGSRGCTGREPLPMCTSAHSRLPEAPTWGEASRGRGSLCISPQDRRKSKPSPALQEECWGRPGQAGPTTGRAAGEAWGWILSGKWRPDLLELSRTTKTREKGKERTGLPPSALPPSSPAHPAVLFVALLQVEVQMGKAERTH